MTTTLNPAEAHFRLYEPVIADIVSRYPSPSEISFTGAGQSTVRINIKLAMENYLKHTSINSPVSRETVTLILREFIFSNAEDRKVYIGPRRPTRRHRPLHLASSGETTTLSHAMQELDPINCSDPTTFHAIMHLKNYDHIKPPVKLTNLNPANYQNLESTYPNIELLTTPEDGVHILL